MTIRSKPSTKEFRDNFDRTFSKPRETEAAKNKASKSILNKILKGNPRKNKPSATRKELNEITGKVLETIDTLRSIARYIETHSQLHDRIRDKISEIENQSQVSRSLIHRVTNIEREFEKLQITKTLEKAMGEAYGEKEKV